MSSVVQLKLKLNYRLNGSGIEYLETKREILLLKIP